MIGTNTMQSTDSFLHHLKNSPSSSSRILDIPCKVCGDFSSGKHYNIFACDGCAGFFKRSIRRNRQYVCKAKPEGACLVDKTHRNQCRACRLTKCQEAGMNKDAVQHERGPRNSTLRRQHMSQYLTAADLRDPRDPRNYLLAPPTLHVPLDLALPKATHQPHHIRLEHPLPLLPPTGNGPQPHQSTFFYHPGALAALAYQQTSQQPAPLLLGSAQFVQMYSNPATICESAAQLLFMNVKWAKSVPSFTCLILSDQFILLEESWRELFILGASQFRVPLELTSLVQACGVMQREPEKIIPFLQDVKDFQDLLGKIGQFNLDPHEYACLRAIVLFKTNFDRNCNSPVSSTSGNGEATSKTLTDPVTVASIQDNTQLVLNKYMTAAQPCQPLRFGKLLMLLPQLRTINGDTIEELFFRSTIGTIPIVKIICDMYKTTTTTNGN